MCAQHWAGLIEDAEKPAALSSRDGRLLRRVPAPARLEHAELAKALQEALAGQLLTHAKDLIAAAGGDHLHMPKGDTLAAAFGYVKSRIYVSNVCTPNDDSCA